jgi:hypothetical protein
MSEILNNKLAGCEGRDKLVIKMRGKLIVLNAFQKKALFMN